MNQKDLAKFKKILWELKKEIEANIDSIHKTTFSESSNLSNYPDDPSNISSEEFEKPMAYNILNMDQSILEDIDVALHKIENGTYGICEKCGGKISKERLLAKPWARYCVKCREELEQKGLVK